jgi:hypothetical protein
MVIETTYSQELVQIFTNKLKYRYLHQTTLIQFVARSPDAQRNSER